MPPTPKAKLKDPGKTLYRSSSGSSFLSPVSLCVDLVQSIRQLTRGLALINFRREPVYLPDTSLEQQPKFHRYLIGARKLPDLRALRAAYTGRAIHSSVEDWMQQLNVIL